MRSGMLLLNLVGAALSQKIELSNGLITAAIDGMGLVSYADSARPGSALSLSNDSWNILFSQPTGLALSPSSGCAMAASSGGGLSAVVNWNCAAANFFVNVTYELKENASFIAKRFQIESTATSPFTIAKVTPWFKIGVTQGVYDKNKNFLVRENPFHDGGEIVGFGRFDGSQYGFFTSVANPWVKFESEGGGNGDCKMGVNMRNFDIPGSPFRDLTASKCQAKCEETAECQAYVFLTQGCDNQPADVCYLKTVSNATKDTTLQCSCFGAKPFPPPTPAPAGSPMYVVTAYYEPNVLHDPTDKFQQHAYHQTEDAVLGLTTLGQYNVPGSSVDGGFNLGERAAFIECVETYLLDKAARAARTVKVNVAWDESDYQIDVGTEEGRTQYKRIIDKNSEFGATHIVYEPRNTLHASRFNTTDGWGWEAGLWFSMGERLREERWDPTIDQVPQDILDMVAYARSMNVSLLAYAYPCLKFEAMKDYWLGNSLDLSPPVVQDWWIRSMKAFLRKTGGGGFAWDHDIYAGPAEKQYSQWRAWMHILAELRSEFPDMVMDHRQTNHIWGPWYQMAGSYAEPIAGDENPETYGVPINSLHTDHVAADNTRIVNFKYAAEQYLPPSRIPGFVFHQTERVTMMMMMMMMMSDMP